MRTDLVIHNYLYLSSFLIVSLLLNLTVYFFAVKLIEFFTSFFFDMELYSLNIEVTRAMPESFSSEMLMPHVKNTL